MGDHSIGMNGRRRAAETRRDRFKARQRGWHDGMLGLASMEPVTGSSRHEPLHNTVPPRRVSR